MRSLPEGFRALVIGASGGIGQALVQVLQANPRCAEVLALSRQSAPADTGSFLAYDGTRLPW